jgi:molecular chaperone GrpE
MQHQGKGQVHDQWNPSEPVTPPSEPVTPPSEPATPSPEPVIPPAEPGTPPAEPITQSQPSNAATKNESVLPASGIEEKLAIAEARAADLHDGFSARKSRTSSA